MTSAPEPALPDANRQQDQRPAPSSSRLVLAAAVVVTLAAWGSAFAGIRAALVGYAPTHMALFRYLVASLTLAGYALAVRMPLPRWRDLPGLAVVGFIGITFYHTALNYGETVVPAATASFIIASAPVWMALLGAVFLHEKLGLEGWAGIILSFAGVGVIALEQAGGPGGLGLGGRLTWPALAVLGASVASALYSLGQKPYLKSYSALQTAAYIVWTGTVFLLLFGAGLPAEIARAPLAATAACVYIGVVPGAIGYVTWSFVLSKTPASRAGSFLYFVPVVALVVAWVWLGEVPGPGSLVGGLLVLAGVIMVNARGARERGGRAIAGRACVPRSSKTPPRTTAARCSPTWTRSLDGLGLEPCVDAAPARELELRTDRVRAAAQGSGRKAVGARGRAKGGNPDGGGRAVAGLGTHAPHLVPASPVDDTMRRVATRG